MPDDPATNDSTNSKKYYLPALLFAVFGLLLHPLFFIGTLACLVFTLRSRNQKIAMALFGAFCIVVAFGYNVGKEMAVRDNQTAVGKDKTPQ